MITTARYPSASPSDELWAITCYFNPCGYRSRLRNYHIFRSRLRAPLVTVELSFTGTFDLGAEDADVLVQLHAPDVLWQKERLLNVALAALPAGCTKVAWLDCDVVFERDDWREAATDALERHAVIQPFETMHHLPPNAKPGCNGASRISPPYDSIGKALTENRLPSDWLLVPDKRTLRLAPGNAWAARREFLARHGFYDACIVGGGDGPIIAGVLGTFAQVVDYLLMNPRREEHFRAWAEPAFEALRGDLGYSPGAAYHLWHGKIEDRHYLRRRIDFSRFDFDPSTDIAVDPSGCWRWNTDKPEMHDFVRDYFSWRNEDGLLVSRPTPLVKTCPDRIECCDDI